MTDFRRGVEALRAAAGALGVVEQLEIAGLNHKQPGGTGWVAHQCPSFDEHAHGDASFSASSNLVSGYWRCHGCGATGRWPGFHGSANDSGPGPARDVPDIGPVEPYDPAPTCETSWDYHDEDGNVVYRMIRQDQGDGRKSFFVRHPRNGAWPLGMPGSGPTLYGLPELLEALAEGRPVYVTEGEKDAESLRKAGAAATCNSGGAGKFPSDRSLIELFTGADVVVVADRDRPGLRHALDVREKLRGVAASVEIRLPAVGKDVSDHLYNDLGVEDLLPYEEPARAPGAPREDGAGGRRLVMRNASEVQARHLEWLWPKWVPTGNLTLFAGDGGVGKSTFLLGLAALLSNGDEHINGGVAASTIVLSGEDPAAEIILPRYLARKGVRELLWLPYIDNPDYEESPVFPGDIGLLGEAIEESGAKLVILDPGNSMIQVENAHMDSDIRKVLGPLAKLAEKHSCAIVYLIHLNKAVGGSFTQRVIGSVGSVNAARSLLGFLPHPDADREEHVVLAHAKANWARKQESVIFQKTDETVVVDGSAFEVMTFVKVGTTEQSADELVSPGGERESPKLDAALGFVEKQTEDGPVPAKAFAAAADEAGIKRNRLVDAKKALDVVTRKVGGEYLTGRADDFLSSAPAPGAIRETGAGSTN